MSEVRGSFASADEWNSWREGLGEVSELRQSILRDVRERGYVEPLTDIARSPHEIAIRDHDLHESVSSHELNSRKRALLLQIVLEVKARDWLTQCNIRMLGTEALSRIALILRGKYRFYWGTKYLPDDAEQKKYFPVPHMDLKQIAGPSDSFDLFMSAEKMETILDLDRALKEIYRVLKPGGAMVAYVPFDPNLLTTPTRRPVTHAGKLFRESESANVTSPVAIASETPAFQVHGWDLLSKLLSFGFNEAYISMIASSHFGIVANSHLGVFVLTASKAVEKKAVRTRPANVVAKGALPEKLIVLIALPRSGTTMLTSVFAVHSKCEAVYEPWNGKRMSENAEARIEVIAKVEQLPTLSGKMLFVKETAAFQGSIPELRKLYESAPFPVDKHMLMLLRQPNYTFLSEIERRREWWKEDITVNAAAFNGWAEKSKSALRSMLTFGLASGGTAILLEDFAAAPADLLRQLAKRIGFVVEPKQLEYERHLDKRRVRGDLNVSHTPSKIDLAFTLLRKDKIQEIDEIIRGSPHVEWFAAFCALYTLIHDKGGVMPITDIAKSAISTLLSNISPAPH